MNHQLTTLAPTRFVAPGDARRTAFRLAILLAALTIVSGCSPRSRLNVLLVTFDTTRADHIGCYGYNEISTPTLDGLAAESVVFEQAHTAVPITLPSHSTIMTGLYPPAHGARDNGLFVLGDDVPTLASILSGSGYATAAAIGAFPLLGRFGISQGFEFFDDNVLTPEIDFRGRPTIPKHGMFFDERRAEDVNAALLSWFESSLREPFFAWAHYFDPHQPFAPPTPYDQLYATHPYDGEIAYADGCFGRLIARLKELGVWDRTAVVFVADHGEGLGEHDEATHSMLLYETTLHVPLIIRIPGQPPRRVAQPVGTVDIAPTLLDLLEIPNPPEMQGRSLLPAMQGSELEPRALYAETLSPRLSNGWGELRAVYVESRKYIHGPRPELYDLHTDPAELSDLAAARPAEVAEMYGLLDRELQRIRRGEAIQPVDLDSSTRDRLEALGYLGQASDEDLVVVDTLRGDGPPPQDLVASVSDLSAAKQLLVDGRAHGAREVLLDLQRQQPENLAVLEMLASAELQLGRVDRALAWLDELERLDRSSDVRARLELSIAVRMFIDGDLQGSLERCNRALSIQPGAQAEYLRAVTLSRLGDTGGFQAALERTLELDPTHGPARVDLGVQLAAQGRPDAAREAFLQAIHDRPYLPRAHYNLGTLLVATEDLVGATAAFERALAIQPTYIAPQYALLALDIDRGDLASARDRLNQIFEIDPAAPEVTKARQLLEDQ